MATERLEETPERFVDEIWNKGNLAAVDEFCTQDYVEHTMPPGFTPDREGLKKHVAMMRQAFPDLHITVEDTIAVGDLSAGKVASRWTMTGTHTGDLMMGPQTIPATGKRVTLPGISYVRGVNGKAAELWAQSDNLALLMQLGVVPAPA